ncbi:hypothetical protein C8F01DRAFT_1234375 [Mycena amicta]|nr:hypothetical protein C8F01DRAFT_1234375 [Mycena amicta]
MSQPQLLNRYPIALLLALLSLIPDYAVRIILTSILTTLAIAHAWLVHFRPPALLVTVEAAVTDAERIIGEGHAHHVFDHDMPALARYSDRLVQVKHLASVARCSAMKLSVAQCVQYYMLWRQLRQCMADAQEITHDVELLTESKHLFRVLDKGIGS